MNPANGQYVFTPVHGNNVIRFKGFDLDYDKIDQISSNPRAAITPLSPNE